MKGSLFADYVRMIRSHKDFDWSADLAPEDLAYLTQRIQPNDWYPMATFERMGNGILRHIAHGTLDTVRMWGRFQVDQLRILYPTLVADGDPIETLTRFRVLRATFFDFEALEVPLLCEEEAEIIIRYQMGNIAEEAASYQTMGFFERLLEAAGAKDIKSVFKQRSWAGDARTMLALHWRMK